jgi:hypothetical protein
MTQRNIDIMDVIVDKMVAGKTISDALKDVYVKRNVMIPFNEEVLNIGVDKLGMSRRTEFALMRGKMLTLLDVVRYCEKQKITTVNLLGNNAGTETFETILNYLWSKMSKSERVDFLIDTIERNVENLRAELI